MFLPQEIIKKKRNGSPLTKEEIRFFIQSYTQGTLPDYQMSALLMAIYFRGMDNAETYALTEAMLQSGRVLDFSHLTQFKVDKHSTGGVGDKTSLILGPIVAAAGLYVPMISGRGLGHTGGTLDKLESIPGFNTQISLVDFERILKKIGVSFIGQTKDICPADKKIYALRDVTSTVENISLICASIMSKKLAEGINGLVLDVKFGSGAFMKSPADAEALALKLMEIARAFGKKCTALLTNMDQPLGRFAGNALEVFECNEIMQGKSHSSQGRDFYSDTRELSLLLSAHMMSLGGQMDLPAALAKAKELLTSGRAYEKWKELCLEHGGHLDFVPFARNKRPVLAKENGFIQKMDTEKIGLAGIVLKAGRQKTTDTIVPTTGIEFHAKIGDSIKVGDPVFTVHGDNQLDADSAIEILASSYSVSQQSIDRPPLVLKVLSEESP